MKYEMIYKGICVQKNNLNLHHKFTILDRQLIFMPLFWLKLCELSLLFAVAAPTFASTNIKKLNYKN
jgi:hypothetical protein